MRRFGVTALALTVALVVGASFTSGALAKKQKPILVLREGGEHPYEGLDPVLAEFAPVEASVEITFAGGCATTTPIPGSVEENSGAKSDLIGFRAQEKEREPIEAPCLGEYEGKHDTMFAFAGRKLVLTTRGAAAWMMALSVETQNSFGPCLYAFGIKKMAFPVPAPGRAGEAVLKGTAKSGKATGARQCKVKQETAFTISLADNGGRPLETTLEG